MGLRNTLEPDPDNTGVGSFRSRAAVFLTAQLWAPLFHAVLKQGESMQAAAVIASHSSSSFRRIGSWLASVFLLVLLSCRAFGRANRAADAAKPCAGSANHRAKSRSGAAKTRSRHHHRHRPRRSGRQLSSRIRHRGHARWRRAVERSATLGHRRHARPAQRPGLAPALRRGQERRLRRRRLRARGLLRRLPDSRLSYRSRHRP